MADLETTLFVCMMRLDSPFKLPRLIKQFLGERQQGILSDDQDEIFMSSEFYLYWKSKCIASVLFSSDTQKVSTLMKQVKADFKLLRTEKKECGTLAYRNLKRLQIELEQAEKLDEDQIDCLHFIERMMPADFSTPSVEVELSNDPLVLSLSVSMLGQVPSVNDKAFFKELVESAEENWRTKDYSEISYAASGFPRYRREIIGSFTQTLRVPPKSEENILVYDESLPPEEREVRTALFQNRLDSEDMEYLKYHEQILDDGLPVIYIKDKDPRNINPKVTDTYVAEAQMHYLQQLGTLPVSTPNHALFAQVFGDHAFPTKPGDPAPDPQVVLMDPNSESLQGVEADYALFLEESGPDDFKRKCKQPGGWCQTIAWFHQECFLSDRVRMHDEIVNWFECNTKYDAEVEEDAPTSVKDMISACNTKIGEQASEIKLKHRDALCRFVELLASRYMQMVSNILKAGDTDNSAMWFYVLWKATREFQKSKVDPETSLITHDNKMYRAVRPKWSFFPGAERRLTALYKAVKKHEWVEIFEGDQPTVAKKIETLLQQADGTILNRVDYQLKNIIEALKLQEFVTKYDFEKSSIFFQHALKNETYSIIDPSLIFENFEGFKQYFRRQRFFRVENIATFTLHNLTVWIATRIGMKYEFYIWNVTTGGEFQTKFILPDINQFLKAEIVLPARATFTDLC